MNTVYENEVEQMAEILSQYLGDVILTLKYFCISHGSLNFYIYIDLDKKTSILQSTFDLNIFKDEMNAVETLRDSEFAQEYFKWLEYIDNKYVNNKKNIADHFINNGMIEPSFTFDLNKLDELKQQFYGDIIYSYLEKKQFDTIIENNQKTTSRQVKL